MLIAIGSDPLTADTLVDPAHVTMIDIKLKRVKLTDGAWVPVTSLNLQTIIAAKQKEER